MTQQKSPKPKAEVSNNSSDKPKSIIIHSIITIILLTIFVVLNSLWVKHIISEDLKKILPPDIQVDEPIEIKTFPYDLEPFVVNIQDPKNNKYLKVIISLDIEAHSEEPEVGGPESNESSSGHGNTSKKTPEEYYTNIMKPYKMRIRDIIIASFLPYSATELNSNAIREAIKDKIKEELNTEMPADRQIIRVNFGEFIIQ